MNHKPAAKAFTRFALLIYLTLAAATSIGHDWLLDMRVEPINKALHEQVMEGAAPAPIQYRVFQYYAAEGLMKLGLSFRDSYFYLRMLFTFLAAAALHYFLLYWFVPAAAMLGTFYFFAVLPLVYYGYYMQPMDIPNLFFMLAGCLLILKRKDVWLVPLVFIAMLNRETAVLIALVYFLARFDELKIPALALRSGLIFFTGLLTYAALRKVFTMKPYYSDMYYLVTNLSDPRAYTHMLALFGALVPAALWKFKEKPVFLRRALLFIPFFVIIHFTMTIMREPRLWLPVLPFLTAAAFWSMLPKEFLAEAPAPVKPVNNILTRNPKTAYAALLAVFLLFFTGFFFYYKSAHMGERDKKLRVESLVTSARQYAAARMPERAIEELKKAMVLSPQDAAPHYEMGILYENTVYDHRKALEEFRQTLRLDPYHLDRQRIQQEIERLEYLLKK